MCILIFNPSLDRILSIASKHLLVDFKWISTLANNRSSVQDACPRSAEKISGESKGRNSGKLIKSIRPNQQKGPRVS